MPHSRLACCAFLVLFSLPGTGSEAQPAVLVAVGDLACDPADGSFNGGDGTATACRMKATSDLALSLAPTAVLLLGDNQYDDGAAAKYLASFDPSWGRLKAITKPAPGNHDYGVPGAAGYYGYFGAAAGDPAKGYYSFDLAGWHLIALNSNCGAVGGCGVGSPQEQWLAADLAAHSGVCTLAYWHHPRFSSGPHGDDATYDAFWQALYAARADVVLTGHDHIYERFAPQTPGAVADPARGLRAFVVGTGGRNLTSLPIVRANSEVRDAAHFGVLEMTLHPTGYVWRFLAVDGGAVLDQGASFCHSAPGWPSAELYTLPPCRLIDTRNPDGPRGGPPLPHGASRSFPVAGACGIPADAVALSANATIVGPTRSGYLEILPTGSAPTGTSSITFRTGQMRSNNLQIALGLDDAVTVRTALSGAGSVHFVLDVTGYYREEPIP